MNNYIDTDMYEFKPCSRQLAKDLTNLMKCLVNQDTNNKPILYIGRNIKKVILPLDEYQKLLKRCKND